MRSPATGRRRCGGITRTTTLAEQESDPQRRRTLHGLALAEKHHADLWAGRLTALGAAVPEV